MTQLVSSSPDLALERASDPGSNKAALDVTGMKCAGCMRAVEQALLRAPGVLTATVNLATEVATVEYQPWEISPGELADRLTDSGFPSQPRIPTSQGINHSGLSDLQQQRQMATRQQWTRLTIAILLLLLSAIGHLEPLLGIHLPVLGNLWFHAGLAMVALLGPGRAMVIEGWRGLRRNAPNMDTLVSLGTLTACLTSMIALLFPNLGWECFFDEPVMLVGFILLGRTLEQLARNRAATAFQSLLALQPRMARLIKQDLSESDSPITDGAFDLSACSAIEIPAECVRVGEWLQVLPGDKIPVDGQVLIGQTTVNEAMLTGEALPVVKQPGDLVAAGTLNQTGAIVLQATRTGQETTLAQIIALVESAQTRKAPIQRLADRVAGYFTYGVMTFAALTFFFWFLIGTHLWPHTLLSQNWFILGHGSFSHGSSLGHHHPIATVSPLLLSLKLMIAVLVIACPCALGLATPTAILVGSGIGAERGLLLRGGDSLEKIHALDMIVLDKTGTLTAGRATVTDCLPCISELSSQQLLQLAATVESGTRHPLAEAIQTEAQRLGLGPFPARHFITEPGLGVAATLETDENLGFAGKPVYLGSLRWLEQQGIAVEPSLQHQGNAWAQAGKSVVYVAVADQGVGLIAVIDQPRADAAQTIAALKQMGLAVKLITGDQPDTAIALAQQLGLPPDQVMANVSPAEKAATIAQLQQAGHRVAMVGDGINDAPALAQANVGIALNSGTDVAMETADIILMRDRLMDVVSAIRLSRASFNKIRQNLFWAFAYNVLGIPLAAGVLLPSAGILLSPAAAGAMMAFSSLSVVCNSLLLYLNPLDHAIQTAAKSPDPTSVDNTLFLDARGAEGNNDNLH